VKHENVVKDLIAAIELEELRNKCELLQSILEKYSCHSDCIWFGKRHQKCSCCRRNLNIKDNYET
jgi:hypothetical protein